MHNQNCIKETGFRESGYII